MKLFRNFFVLLFMAFLISGCSKYSEVGKTSVLDGENIDYSLLKVEDSQESYNSGFTRTAPWGESREIKKQWDIYIDEIPYESIILEDSENFEENFYFLTDPSKGLKVENFECGMIDFYGSFKGKLISFYLAPYGGDKWQLNGVYKDSDKFEYFDIWSEEEQLNNFIDSDNFRHLGDCWFATDDFIIYEDVAVTDDVENFEILNHYYSKDSEHVYFKHFVVEDADVDSISVDSEKPLKASDKNVEYYRGEVMKN